MHTSRLVIILISTILQCNGAPTITSRGSPTPRTHHEYGSTTMPIHSSTTEKASSSAHLNQVTNSEWNSDFWNNPMHWDQAYTQADWDDLHHLEALLYNDPISSPLQVHSSVNQQQRLQASPLPAKHNFLNLDIDSLQRQLSKSTPVHLQEDHHTNLHKSNVLPSHINAVTTLNEQSGEEAISPFKKRPSSRSYSKERYDQFPWQRYFHPDEQEQIYAELRQYWGPYEVNRFHQGFKNVREQLDVKSARLILAEDVKTITEMGKLTNPREKKKYKKEKKIQSIPFKRSSATTDWINGNIKPWEKSRIMHKMQSYWKGMDRKRILERLNRHYKDHLKAALLSDDSHEFALAASYIDEVVEKGKRSGAQRVHSHSR